MCLDMSVPRMACTIVWRTSRNWARVSPEKMLFAPPSSSRTCFDVVIAVMRLDFLFLFIFSVITRKMSVVYVQTELSELWLQFNICFLVFFFLGVFQVFY